LVFDSVDTASQRLAHAVISRSSHWSWWSGPPEALGASACRSFGFLALELTVAFEVALALVLAQNAGLVHAGLEPAQELIEAFAFTWLNVHCLVPPSATVAASAGTATSAATAALLKAR
jgi:hypothetical protein